MSTFGANYFAFFPPSTQELKIYPQTFGKQTSQRRTRQLLLCIFYCIMPKSLKTASRCVYTTFSILFIYSHQLLYAVGVITILQIKLGFIDIKVTHPIFYRAWFKSRLDPNPVILPSLFCSISNYNRYFSSRTWVSKLWPTLHLPGFLQPAS